MFDIGAWQPKKITAILVVTLFLGSALISGCSSKFGPQTTKVEHYPDCYQPISEIRASEFMVEESTVAGAIVGALVGGLIGYAAGGGRGAVAGAAVGGVTGGIISNQYARISQERDDMRRLQYYSSQLEETVTGMDATTAAAMVARQCYERQFQVAVSEFQSGYITRDQFQARHSEVASGLEEASRVLGMTIDSVAEVSAAYEQALANESRRLNLNAQTMAEMHTAALQDARTQNPAPQTQPQRQATRPASRPASRPATNLPTEVDGQLNTMVNNGAAVQNSLDNARAERDLINARLDLTNQMAADLLSHSGELRFSSNERAIN